MTRIDNKPGKTVAVIGAGIVGVCTALSLQRAGFKVTVFDKNGVAQSASKGNAGHFATEQLLPLADKRLLLQLPKMLLAPSGPFKVRLQYFVKAVPWFLQFVMNMGKAKFNHNKRALAALNRRALAAYQPLLELAGATELCKFHGSLLVTQQSSPKALQMLFDTLVNNGVAAKFLDRKQLLGYQPNLNDKVKWGILFTEVGHTTNPERLCQQLFLAFIRLGGRYKKAEIAAIQQAANQGSADEQKVTVLLTDDTCMSYNKAVVASGAWSKNLVNGLGYQVPLDTERGYHLMLPERDLINLPIASYEHKFIMTPMTTGLRLAGTVEFAGLKLPADPSRAHALYSNASKVLADLPQHDPRTLPYWMGCRPSLPDSLPVIGQAPHHSAIYFAFGHQHLGLTQGAITAELLTELLSGKAPSMDLKPYCISRFN